jgi:hypothetical protein
MSAGDLMRIAIFSDVHGNLQALDAVLAGLRRRVEYDVEGAAAAIRAAGLPEAFAVDLLPGSRASGPAA